MVDFILSLPAKISAFEAYPILLFLFAMLARTTACRGVPQGFDSHGHFYFAKELKTQKAGAFGSINTKVIEGVGFSVPFLWHWIVGLFPLSLVRKYQQYLNPLLDSLFALFIYLFFLSVGYSEGNAILGYLLYVFTPMWFSRLAIGPRIESFTPRLSSEIATNIFFVFVCLLPGAPLWFVTLGGSGVAAFVLASSKFGIQSLLFLTPLISLFLGSWDPLLALFGGLVILAILSRGRFLNSFNQQLNHLRFYFLKNLKGEVAVSSRNKLGSEYLRKPGEGLIKYAARFIATLAFRNSYAGVLIKLPLLWISIIVSISEMQFLVADNIWGPVASGVILFFLINIPLLLFLGEAERYLNHVAIFIVLWGVTIADKTDYAMIYWGLVFYGLVYLVVEAFALPFFTKEVTIEESENLKIIDYLRTLKSSIVLCYPYHAGGGVYRVMADTAHRTIFLFGTTDEFVKKFEKKYSSSYPYADLYKLDDMRCEFDINVLIVRNRDIESRLKENWRPSSNWSQVDLGLSQQSVFVYSDTKAKNKNHGN